MTCDRPYRNALDPGYALEEIRSGAGTQFDPTVVQAFVAAVRATV
jgi:HD-GYP domain-containing protein (c-di-GMP phosphodiesterase class II)